MCRLWALLDRNWLESAIIYQQSKTKKSQGRNENGKKWKDDFKPKKIINKTMKKESRKKIKKIKQNKAK